MRIKIIFSKNTEPVPNNQSPVNSYFHDCLGRNNKYHDGKSDYCLTHMMGGEVINKGRDFTYPQGGFVIFTSPDSELVSKLMLGILANPKFGYGMEFKTMLPIDEKFYNGWNYFKTTDRGMLVVKSNNKDEKRTFWTLNDPEFTQILKQRTINKLTKINPELDFTHFNIEIIKHPNHTVEKRYVNRVLNKTNVCQLNVYCNKKVAEMIYNYGLGQSTGSGHGTVYMATNHHKMYTSVY